MDPRELKYSASHSTSSSLNHTFIKLNNADIRIHPGQTCDVRALELIIGDLHGNALKLIYILILQKYLDMSVSDYNKLVHIYYKPTKTLKDYEEWSKLVVQSIVETAGSIRLLGDVLCDRGEDDFLTLLLMEELRKKKIILEIVFSNHDAEFVRNFCITKENKSDFSLSEKLKKSYGEHFHFYVSCINLFKQIDEKIITKESVEALINHYYKPSLKLMSYSRNDSCYPPELTLYTHAPIGIPQIKKLAWMLDRDYLYQDDTIEQLINAIDFINRKFSELNFLEINKFYSEPASPIHYVIWNRKINIKLTTAKPGAFLLRIIHGHLGGNHPTKIGCYNMDCDFGKAGSRHKFKGSLIFLTANKEVKSCYEQKAFAEHKYPLRDRISLTTPKKETWCSKLLSWCQKNPYKTALLGALFVASCVICSPLVFAALNIGSIFSCTTAIAGLIGGGFLSTTSVGVLGTMGSIIGGGIIIGGSVCAALIGVFIGRKLGKKAEKLPTVFPYRNITHNRTFLPVLSLSPAMKETKSCHVANRLLSMSPPAPAMKETKSYRVENRLLSISPPVPAMKETKFCHVESQPLSESPRTPGMKETKHSHIENQPLSESPAPGMKETKYSHVENRPISVSLPAAGAIMKTVDFKQLTFNRSKSSSFDKNFRLVLIKTSKQKEIAVTKKISYMNSKHVSREGFNRVVKP